MRPGLEGPWAVATVVVVESRTQVHMQPVVAWDGVPGSVCFVAGSVCLVLGSVCSVTGSVCLVAVLVEAVVPWSHH